LNVRPHVIGALGVTQQAFRVDPSGLVDVTRTAHLPADGQAAEPPLADGLLDLPVDGDRVVRIDPSKAAFVIIDMQKCAADGVPSGALLTLKVAFPPASSCTLTSDITQPG
jgi:hypothetical protein